tara:strand:+ start:942 stop:1427 length:486 start_codon:yes stop_codon:yes gene_type:complete
MRLLLTLLASLLVGCSPLARVSSNTNAIREEAQVLIDYGQSTGDKEVVTRAQRINDLAADTHVQLSGLEDKVPAWLTTLWMVALAVVVLGVVVLLWQTGLGTAVRVAVGWLPRAKVRDADLAAGMLNPDNPENAREYVAARRASDPEFDAAWRRIQKKGSQ